MCPEAMCLATAHCALHSRCHHCRPPATCHESLCELSATEEAQEAIAKPRATPRNSRRPEHLPIPGDTALHLAAKNDHVGAIEMLLQFSAGGAVNGGGVL